MTRAQELARGGRMPRSARRKQLLQAAQEVFVANGYHAAAMDDIAERAGVSKPVLYQHFPGKLELYLALMDTQAEALRRAVVEALAGTTDNRERIHRVLVGVLPLRRPRRARRRVPADLRDRSRQRAGGARAGRGWSPSQTMQAVADTVAADTGLSRPQAELLATSLTGAAQIASRWWLSSGKPIPQDEAVRLLEALLWRGISNFPRQ